MSQIEEPVIMLAGYIDSDMFLTIADALQDLKGAPVKLIINSEGGCPEDALAICALIDAYDNRVSTHAVGRAWSSASLILAAGAKGHRTIAKEAWLLVHETHTKVKGFVTKMRRDINHLDRMERQWIDILVRYTGKASEELTQLHCDETYLSADEAVAWGFADEVTK